MKGYQKLIMLCVVVVAVTMVSCVTTIDPTTGQKKTSLSPKVVDTIDSVVGVAEPVAIGTGVLFPGVAGTAGIVLGLVGMWKRLKPQVIAEKKQKEMNHNVIFELVTSIELYKKEYPDDWKKLGDIFGCSLPYNVENTIKEIKDVFKVKK